MTSTRNGSWPSHGRRYAFGVKRKRKWSTLLRVWCWPTWKKKRICNPEMLNSRCDPYCGSVWIRFVRVLIPESRAPISNQYVVFTDETSGHCSSDIVGVVSYGLSVRLLAARGKSLDFSLEYSM